MSVYALIDSPGGSEEKSEALQRVELEYLPMGRGEHHDV